MSAAPSSTPGATELIEPRAPSLLDRIRVQYRALERLLAHRAPARILVALPRTARFVGATLVRRFREPVPGLPAPNISPAFAAQVAMDEAILAMAMGPNRFPRRSDYERVGAELGHARVLFETRGWLDDPRSYHRTPPPLEEPAIGRGWALNARYERLLFPSGWEPRPDEPGARRWSSYEPNRTAVATVLRHRDGPRPWLVAIHGFGMGYPFMDFVGLHGLRIHRELGLNVVLPVLPLHGPRKITRFSGEAFLSFDLVNTVHGITQAMWDIRRVISWIRTREPTAIGVYGVSLGGYSAALLASLEDDLDCVIAGIPVADFPALFRAHSPTHIRMRALEHSILGGNAEVVHRVISPLAIAPCVAEDRRFIYAGLGDRLARPTQAHLLWKHWDEPNIHWYGGNHVGYLWSRQVREYVVESLRAAGLSSGPAPAR
ncbi:MAG: alpha/beta hydrolase family protein [Acidimicrobiia bacterium]